MPVRMPSPEEVGLTPLEPTRPLTSYQGGIAAKGQEVLGQSFAQAGQQVEQVGLQYQNAADVVAMAGANSAFLQSKLKLDQQFGNDQDYATKADRYSTAIQQAANDAAAKIPGAQTRTQFLDRTLRWQEYGINQMRYQAHQMSVQADQGYAKNLYDTTIDSALQAPDEPTRAGLFTSFGQTIDALTAKGSITASQGVQLKRSMQQQFATRKAETMLNTDPGLAARLLAPDAPALPAGVSADVGAGIHRAAAVYDVPADWLARTAQLESSGGTHNGPSSAGASGPFQLMPAVAAQYHVNPQDPTGSAEATAQLYQHNRTVLQQGLGRDPTGAELYLAHQQGAAGALMLLTHPDQNAVDVLSAIYHNRATAQAAITGNGGATDMTAGQFSQMWEQKFGNAPGAPQFEGKHPTASPDVTDQSGAAIFPKYNDWRDFLQPDVRAKMWRQAVDYSQSQNNVLAASLRHSVGDMQAALLDGQNVTIPEQEIRTVLPPDEAQRTLENLTIAKGAGQVFQAVHWAPSDQISQEYKDLSSGMGPISSMLKGYRAGLTTAGPGQETPEAYRLRMSVLGQFQQLVQKRDAALRTDPAGYVANEPTVAKAAAAVANAQSDADKATAEQAYVTATLAVQQRLGVLPAQQHVLPAGQAQAVAHQLSSLDPSKADVGGQLSSIAKQYGSAWPKVFGDLVTLGKLSPDYQVLAAMPDPVHRTDFQRTLAYAAQKGGLAAMKADVPPQAAKDIDQGLPDALAPFIRTASIPGLASNLGLISTVRDSIQKLAYFYGIQGQDGSDALQHATDAVLNDKYDFDGTMRVPRGMLPAVETATDNLVSGLKASDMAGLAADTQATVTPGGTLPGLTLAQRQEVDLRAARRGQWVPNEDDSGLVLVGRLANGAMIQMKRADGSRIELSFAAMKQAAASAAGAAPMTAQAPAPDEFVGP